ncbi:MAG: helix-turn-helix transcriptional regulator [Treponema sp.]|jgi:DNA-binding CsgD family transcriptional regulator|nr:helix-turn-helix transcriptional regulator [Treponema sp.]
MSEIIVKNGNLPDLTLREREIFDMLLEGISPKEVAYTLNISYNTVQFHRKSLYRKLGVHSVQELFAKYSAINKTTNSAQAEQPAEEKLVLKPFPCPFELALIKNPPYGWCYEFEPDVFQYNRESYLSPFKLGKGSRLVEGDLWHVTCFFTTNVDLDWILVCFVDTSIEEDNFYTELSVLCPLLGSHDVKANTRCNLSAKILVTKTASGETPLENKFKLNVGGVNLEAPPLLTFHKFELTKLPQNNILKSVKPAQIQLSQKGLPVPNPLIITFLPNDAARSGGWIYRLHPDVFLYNGKKTASPFKLGEGNRIVEDDIFLINLFFTSNVDIDFFQIHFLDRTKVADRPWIMLSPYLTLKKNIKANEENNITTKLLINRTASGTEPDENQFVLAAGYETKEAPTLTFTKFEVVKI